MPSGALLYPGGDGEVPSVLGTWGCAHLEEPLAAVTWAQGSLLYPKKGTQIPFALGMMTWGRAHGILLGTASRTWRTHAWGPFCTLEVTRTSL